MGLINKILFCEPPFTFAEGKSLASPKILLILANPNLSPFAEGFSPQSIANFFKIVTQNPPSL